MNDILKQRLVGTLILLALGVVFWPIIFVEPGEQASTGMSRIPARPQIDSSPIAVPGSAGLRVSPVAVARQQQQQEQQQGEQQQQQLPEAVEPAPVPAAVPAPAVAATEGKRTRSTAPAAPVLDADGVPVAWILQVASVSSAAKANELRDRLIALRHKAYVKKLKVDGRDLYRVYIGPKFEKAVLEDVRGQIDSEFAVTSMITRYVP